MLNHYCRTAGVFVLTVCYR